MIVLLGLILLPIVEIVVAVQVGQAIGLWPTLALLLAGSAAGEMVLRRAGRRTGQRLREALDAGRAPGTEAGDSALLLLGGLLLLIPGFVTDVVGLFFVLPFTRPLARRLVARGLGRRVRVVGEVIDAAGQGATRGRPAYDDVIEGEVVDDRPAQDSGPRSLGG